MLYFQIEDNYKFCQKLFLFLEYIIKYFIYPDPYPKTLHHICLDPNTSITIPEFAILLNQDSKSIA